MALPELIQITREDLQKWIPEFRRWAKACDENDRPDLARKAYIVAQLMYQEFNELECPEGGSVSSFFRKSVEPDLKDKHS